MAGKIYGKPVAFAVMATVVILVGSIVTMAYPMLRPEMHPRLDALRPFSALQLAGRDLYQREGCVGCHTQTVRPLASEVARYGEYSKAGEFAYDRPFLWGSKRTGPDLARESWLKPSEAWQKRHLRNPQEVFPRSNMPRYAFLEQAKLDPAETASHMRALMRVGTPYTDAQIAAETAALAGKTEMDALVAYVVSLGSAVPKPKIDLAKLDLATANPHGDDPAAVARGQKLYVDQCSACHGDDARGQEGTFPSLVDEVFLGQPGDGTDGAYFAIIAGGSDAKGRLGRAGMPDGGMAAFAGQLTDDDIWDVISYLRAQKAHEAKETPKTEAGEHGQPVEKHQ